MSSRSAWMCHRRRSTGASVVGRCSRAARGSCCRSANFPSPVCTMQPTHSPLLRSARPWDCDVDAMLSGLLRFRGLPHRLQKVAEVRGVTFYDDSKGTNVGATVAALNGMSVPVVLIAGGDGKGQAFSPLRAAIAARARAVVLIGRDADAIAQVLEGVEVDVLRAASMEEAVERAFAASRSRRRSAALAGVCELRHVQKLRASRRGFRRGRARHRKT